MRARFDKPSTRFWIAEKGLCEAREDSWRATAERNGQHHILAVSPATVLTWTFWTRKTRWRSPQEVCEGLILLLRAALLDPRRS
jgi:hypothetical protein